MIPCSSSFPLSASSAFLRWLSAEEKNALSHRRKALEALKGKLEEQGII